MRARAVCFLLAVGCGGGGAEPKRPRDPVAEAERARIDAMKPASPYETLRVQRFRAATACGQGPYRIAVDALGAKYGEQIAVHICAPRHLEGDYRLTREGNVGEPRHFGTIPMDDTQCLATAAERAALPAGDASGAAGSTNTGGASTSGPLGAPRAQPVALERVEGGGEECPGELITTYLVDHKTEYADDKVPLPAGAALVVELWSAVPMNLTGATFTVVQRGVRADMTLAGWTEYRAAWDRWRDANNAFVDGQVAAGRTKLLDMTAHTADAPPAAKADIRPPRPSTHAEWIGGYWQREGTWIWSPGFWRVPETDIIAEQTVEAPAAPPPVKVEVVSAPPASKVVWTPGYWAWNGTAWLWIEGAWRIPPANAQWVAPSWTPRRGRVVFAPGGWSVRIGR